jgi:hypothetical protein
MFMAFELYVWGTWISSANFGRVRVNDASSVTSLTRTVILITQVISPIITVSIIARFLLWPLFRDRRLTTDGMLVISWFFLWFQDPLGNLVSTQLYYSSAWVSMGSWTLGSFPGWISPAGNQLPEPILVMGFGYLWLGFSAGLVSSWAMGKVRNLWPKCSALELALVALFLCVILDVTAEVSLAAAGTFAWPCAIKGLSLFHGRPYQFPMYEGILFGATIAAGGVLRFFRDDRGQTWVEKGLERLTLPRPTVTAVKFFAIFGFMHLFMATVYSIPMNWFGMHSDSCLRYPAHLENNLCVVGVNGGQCPGPGIPMPRPPYF